MCEELGEAVKIKNRIITVGVDNFEIVSHPSCCVGLGLHFPELPQAAFSRIQTRFLFPVDPLFYSERTWSLATKLELARVPLLSGIAYLEHEKHLKN